MVSKKQEIKNWWITGNGMMGGYEPHYIGDDEREEMLSEDNRTIGGAGTNWYGPFDNFTKMKGELISMIQSDMSEIKQAYSHATSLRRKNFITEN